MGDFKDYKENAVAVPLCRGQALAYPELGKSVTQPYLDQPGLKT